MYQRNLMFMALTQHDQDSNEGGLDTNIIKKGQQLMEAVKNYNTELDPSFYQNINYAVLRQKKYYKLQAKNTSASKPDDINDQRMNSFNLKNRYNQVVKAALKSHINVRSLERDLIAK